MPHYHGINPLPATRLAAERFENEVMIRHNNRFLVASVYLDMEQIRWAVAIAYNPARITGLAGFENVLEGPLPVYAEQADGDDDDAVRSHGRSGNTRRSILNPDAFVRYALSCEMVFLGRTGYHPGKVD